MKFILINTNSKKQIKIIIKNIFLFNLPNAKAAITPKTKTNKTLVETMKNSGETRPLRSIILKKTSSKSRIINRIINRYR